MVRSVEFWMREDFADRNESASQLCRRAAAFAVEDLAKQGHRIDRIKAMRIERRGRFFWFEIPVIEVTR